MPLSMLYPFNEIQPEEFLSQYNDWIYFFLIMVFFISVAGITLRRHFDKPYVKPLIISTGLIMTLGVFMMKDKLAIIIEGWGVLGGILLVIMAAAIPYGLCRGFGMPSGRAFYISYALIYIISWVKYPDFYYILAEHNLGLVNLGLLILFLIAIYKSIKIKKRGEDFTADMETQRPFKPDIKRELKTQKSEKKAIKKKEEKITKSEIKTIQHIEEALAEIQRIIEIHKNNLSTADRKSIGEILVRISKSEDIFLQRLGNLKKTFESINIMDEKQLKEMQSRLSKVSVEERKILESEIKLEEEKIKTERTMIEDGKKLENWLKIFNNFIHQGIQKMQGSAYPFDSAPYLAKARVVLKDIVGILQKLQALEDRLLRLTKAEKTTLKKELKKT